VSASRVRSPPLAASRLFSRGTCWRTTTRRWSRYPTTSW
jgi:hypothetical protein